LTLELPFDGKTARNQNFLPLGKNKFCAARGCTGSLVVLKGYLCICAALGRTILINYDINAQHLVIFPSIWQRWLALCQLLYSVAILTGF